MLKYVFLFLLLLPFSQLAFGEEIPDYNKPYAPIFLISLSTVGLKKWKLQLLLRAGTQE